MMVANSDSAISTIVTRLNSVEYKLKHRGFVLQWTFFPIDLS